MTGGRIDPSFRVVSRLDSWQPGNRSSWIPWPASAGRRPGAVGIALSAVVHLVLMVSVTLPRPSPPDPGSSTGTLRLVDLPPRVEVPPAPEKIEAPPPPEVTGVDAGAPAVDAEAALSPSPPAPRIEPPEVQGTAGVTSTIARVEVAPAVERPEIFRQRLARYSVGAFETPGSGGVVELRLYVGPRGDVGEVEVRESSGHRRLDRAARRVARQIGFLPALNRDRPVGVWVSQRICFVRVEGPRPDLTPAECEEMVGRRGG